MISKNDVFLRLNFQQQDKSIIYCNDGTSAPRNDRENCYDCTGDTRTLKSMFGHTEAAPR